jgi:hypothetical protein
MKVRDGLVVDDYLITESGEVYSLKYGSERLLKHVNDGGGYSQVSFAVSKDVNKSCRVSNKVHILVYLNYVGDIPKGMTINHVDGDKSNNHYTNLQLVTHKENSDHAVKGLLRDTKRKLTQEQARAIRTLRCVGHPVREISKKFGVSYKAVYQILNHVTYREGSQCT